MKKDLPISHNEIRKLTREKSRSPTVERASSSTDAAAQTQRRATSDATDHGASSFTVGNLTWSERMLNWRRSAYKKKDKNTGRHIYYYTEWPICERFKWEPEFVNSSSRMSRQYFDCDFTWEMAVEADKIAYRMEQSARKGKGKGKGQPESQTFEV